MDLIIKIMFVFNISLILVHEMDSIRCKEWNMFVILKDLREDVAYKVFTFLHIPIYTMILYWLFFLQSNIGQGYLILDIFFVLHMLVHWGFAQHKKNEFKTRFSQWIINVLGISSLLHLTIVLISNNNGVI